MQVLYLMACLTVNCMSIASGLCRPARCHAKSRLRHFMPDCVQNPVHTVCSPLRMHWPAVGRICLLNPGITLQGSFAGCASTLTHEPSVHRCHLLRMPAHIPLALCSARSSLVVQCGHLSVCICALRLRLAQARGQRHSLRTCCIDGCHLAEQQGHVSAISGNSSRSLPELLPMSCAQ